MYTGWYTQGGMLGVHRVVYTGRHVHHGGYNTGRHVRHGGYTSGCIASLVYLRVWYMPSRVPQGVVYALPCTSGCT